MSDPLSSHGSIQKPQSTIRSIDATLVGSYVTGSGVMWSPVTTQICEIFIKVILEWQRWRNTPIKILCSKHDLHSCSFRENMKLDILADALCGDLCFAGGCGCRTGGCSIVGQALLRFVCLRGLSLALYGAVFSSAQACRIGKPALFLDCTGVAIVAGSSADNAKELCCAPCCFDGS
jgi:hypothetical protein